jgi:hypothetical protein
MEVAEVTVGVTVATEAVIVEIVGVTVATEAVIVVTGGVTEVVMGRPDDTPVTPARRAKAIRRPQAAARPPRASRRHSRSWTAKCREA